jgi:hypothetical protein
MAWFHLNTPESEKSYRDLLSRVAVGAARIARLDLYADIGVAFVAWFEAV